MTRSPYNVIAVSADPDRSPPLQGVRVLDFTQNLFMTALNRGRQYILNSGGEWSAVRLPDLCDRTRDFAGNDLKDVNGEDQRLQQDRHFVIRAWMAVVAYLLADYKFVFS